MKRTTFALLIAVLAAVGLHAGDWSQWRGADRSNVSQETGLLQEWPKEGPPLLWRSVGLGHAAHSVSVVNGRVFTITNEDGAEFVAALDAKTGEKLWATRLGDAVEENPHMLWFAQRTPTVDGDLLFVVSSAGELFCLGSADGGKIWQHNYTKDFEARRPTWGFSDRPLVEGERLICTPFGAQGTIAALNKRTGAILWHTKLENPPRAANAALIASDAGGVRQFVVLSTTGLFGFAADDGRKLWDYSRTIHVGSSYTPIVSGDDLYSPSGYGDGMVGIRLLKDGVDFQVQELYQRDRLLCRFDPFQEDTARVGDCLFTCDTHNPMCIELKSGVATWKAELPKEIGRVAMVYADRCLYLRDLNGVMMLMNVSPQAFKLAGRFQISEHEPTFGATAPVVAGGRLYLRDSSRMFCYDVSADALSHKLEEPHQALVKLTPQESGEIESKSRISEAGSKDAPAAVTNPTPPDIAQRMLQEAGVKNTDVVVDLGCGDGRIVIAAAKKYGCRAVGYEIDPKLVELSRANVVKEKLVSLVGILEGDIFKEDFSTANVVTVFLHPSLIEKLIPQFDKLKPGCRIVSHQFDMPGVEPDRVITMKSNDDGEDHRILIWTTPLKKKSAG
jgi:SAM-dependent methyltransferase